MNQFRVVTVTQMGARSVNTFQSGWGVRAWLRWVKRRGSGVERVVVYERNRSGRWVRLQNHKYDYWMQQWRTGR